jgi:hypothetical protein
MRVDAEEGLNRNLPLSKTLGESLCGRELKRCLPEECKGAAERPTG